MGDSIFGTVIILSYGCISLFLAVTALVRVKSFVSSTTEMTAGRVDPVPWMKQGSLAYTSLTRLAKATMIFCFIFLCYSVFSLGVLVASALGFLAPEVSITPSVWDSVMVMAITLGCAGVLLVSNRRLGTVDGILTGE
ncbi:hypothetical protein ACUY2L_04050 [Corynebacterium mastitidis]